MPQIGSEQNPIRMSAKRTVKVSGQYLKNENIEIHADVNTDSKQLSSKYKNVITGYIKGCGFSVKTKPQAFVASSIADLHTRKA